MNEVLLWALLFFSVVGVLLIIAVLSRTRHTSRGIDGSDIREELRIGREESRAVGRELRDELANNFKLSAESNEKIFDGIRSTVDTRIKELQEGNERKLGQMRQDVADGLRLTTDSLSKSLETMGKLLQSQHDGRTKQMREHFDVIQLALEKVRATLDSRVKELQEGNEKKLEDMRKTVDEKLQGTLEKRLGESFKLVSDRLEAVHKGLGEMQTLATGVGDLKRVLTNVKARGTWAEVQLGALLEQVLSADQFQRNVCVKEGSAERVEYAIRLPGPKSDPESHIWLPIDSKFPQEDYVRLQEAADRADPAAVQAASDALAKTIRGSAKEICEKYVNPPSTTDFAIMFLATEGLYAEVLRQPALVEDLQNRFRVVLAGPTTLVAILSSLRMGFQTLVVEQRASEVWKVLGAVKTEFGKFGDVLDKVKRQLGAASNTIDETGVRTRAIERKLRSVSELPATQSASLTDFAAVDRISGEFSGNEDEALAGEDES
jgi:DNA recombination protein RmuC